MDANKISGLNSNLNYIICLRDWKNVIEEIPVHVTIGKMDFWLSDLFRVFPHCGISYLTRLRFKCLKIV